MSLSRAARILVVDDNAALRRQPPEILDDAGYAVAPRAQLREARERAKSGFDVALVDLRLPDGDGTALAARAQGASCPSPRWCCSPASPRWRRRSAAVRAGAFAYLSSRARRSDLLLTLEQAMRQVRLHAEKRELARRAQIDGEAGRGRHDDRGPVARDPQPAQRRRRCSSSVLERRVRKLAEDRAARRCSSRSGWCATRSAGWITSSRTSSSSRGRASSTPRAGGRGAAAAARAWICSGGEAERAGCGSSWRRRAGELPSVAGRGGAAAAGAHQPVLNALEATPAGGWVRVSARARRATGAGHVDDTGPGVPPELRERHLRAVLHHQGRGLRPGAARSCTPSSPSTAARSASRKSAFGGARFWVGCRARSGQASGFLAGELRRPISPRTPSAGTGSCAR